MTPNPQQHAQQAQQAFNDEIARRLGLATIEAASEMIAAQGFARENARLREELAAAQARLAVADDAKAQAEA